MTKLSSVEIPFCNNEVYNSLSMQSRCVLLGMYHLWLANDKRDVVFDTNFKQIMGGILSVVDFDYFMLGRNSRTKYAKLCLVVKKQGFAFVFGTEVQHGAKRYANARSRTQNARPQMQNARSRVQNARLQVQNKPERKAVIVVETPQHDSFING